LSAQLSCPPCRGCSARAGTHPHTFYTPGQVAAADPQNHPRPPRPRPRVSFETSFDSKQPKLEPKLVSALSETKRLFRLFRFYTETKSCGVSIEPKQTEDQPKQFVREHILVFFLKI
jgi:hypothetical protein